MSPSSTDIPVAAAIAALGVDLIVHPLDTLITRIQSPEYATTYKNAKGVVQPALFRGVYQGLSPTLVMSLPASVAFFAIYETAKSTFQGRSERVPDFAVHAASSAVADLVACAMLNPVEVIKQNAQVVKASSGSGARNSPVLMTLKQFSKHPTKMWIGYTALAATHLPGTSLTFCLYEYLKAAWLDRLPGSPSVAEQVKISTCTAGVAGACVHMLLVPVDVVKTRMRLAAGKFASQPRPPGTVIAIAPISPISIVRDILVREGVRGLFRGTALTGMAAFLGSGLFLGCYDGLILYSKQSAGFHIS